MIIAACATITPTLLSLPSHPSLVQQVSARPATEALDRLPTHPGIATLTWDIGGAIKNVFNKLKETITKPFRSIGEAAEKFTQAVQAISGSTSIYMVIGSVVIGALFIMFTTTNLLVANANAKHVTKHLYKHPRVYAQPDSRATLPPVTMSAYKNL